MTPAQFQHALQLGLGRARLYARSYDTAPLRDIILDACLHCYAYDTQVEGTRGWYMHEIVSELPDREFYCDAVLASLASATDDADGVQRFRIASYLAEDGYPGAKAALYEHFRPWRTWGGEVAYGFVDLDGIDGLLFVADKVGALLVEDQSVADLGWVVRHAYEKLGKQVCLDVLGAAAADNPRIAAFLREFPAFDWKLDDPCARLQALDALSYAELAGRMDALSRLGLMRWGEKTSDDNLKLAAEGLLAATDPAQQLHRLRIFARRSFPLDPAPLFAFASRPDTAWAALAALEHVTHPRVRELAFDLVRTQSEYRGEAIDLLVENFQPGDHALALGWFEAESDREVLHSLGFGLRALWERHPDDATLPSMLLALYERGPCSECRWHALRHLIEIDAFPAALREECDFDCHEDIRKLSGGGEAPA